MIFNWDIKIGTPSDHLRKNIKQLFTDQEYLRETAFSLYIFLLSIIGQRCSIMNAR